MKRVNEVALPIINNSNWVKVATLTLPGGTYADAVSVTGWLVRTTDSALSANCQLVKSGVVLDQVRVADADASAFATNDYVGGEAGAFQVYVASRRRTTRTRRISA